jgi:2-hydroxy-6-oxo-6-(2'-aminophenyl)hexa-2,4-dienoate hydrolase
MDVELESEAESVSLDSSYVTVDGVETHYWEAGTGTPLVLVHGGGGGADAWGNWKFALPRLAERGFHVFAPDMVGFGMTDAPDPSEYEYTNQSRVDHLAAFLRTLDVDAPSLLGNSMGGAASIGVALQHPELVEQLVLVGPAGATHPREWSEETLETVRKLGGLGDSREDMHGVIDVLSDADWYDREPLIDRRLENLDRPGVQAAHEATMSAVRDGDMYYEPETLGRVEHETLILHGKDDAIVPPSDAWTAFETIDGASIVVLADCGHWVMVDRVEEATSLVASFFEHRA